MTQAHADPPASTAAVVVCHFDPAHGKPNPLGMRAFVTLRHQQGETTVVYEQLPSPIDGSYKATLASRRTLTLYDLTLKQARELLRREPRYYTELLGDQEARFAAVDALLTCREETKAP